MAFENLPGIFPRLIDGNLMVGATTEDPKTLVLGTSPRGTSESLYHVTSISDAANAYGRTDGTLIKGMYEVIAGGAKNVYLYRIGATPAILAGISTGITITTVEKDDNAGSHYRMFWNDTSKRLKVWRESDGLLVYDNNPAYPSAAVDLMEVSVTGTATASPVGDIGTDSFAGAILLSSVTMLDTPSVTGITYTAGTDGILLSRMKLFEALYQAYKLLANEDVDIVVPQNVYLDDANVMDMITTEVTAVNLNAPWAATSAYPTPGSFYDVLGKVYVQEYQGEYYFWWDMDRDGVAEIYPAGHANTDMNGTALTADIFHEANFGYQLADFCYRQSEDNAEVIGVIGMLPPVSWSLKDVANWVGREPVWAEDSVGNLVVTTNGTGLLGNKWKAGRLANNATGLPGHVVNNVDGLAYGGFIATDDGWPDGIQQYDRNEKMVDIGKYVSVVGGQVISTNPTSASSYVGTGAAVYAGLVASLNASSAPTNKVQPGVRLPFRVSVAKLDALAGMGYVMFQAKPKGIVVSDAPTGSRPDSDYRRLTTVRIVVAALDAIRTVSEPFLGEPISGARLAALETSIDQALLKLQKAGYLQRYKAVVTSTPNQQVLGQADVELQLVPAFELRQVSVYVSLAKQ